jgi:nicotinamidase-related amidase
VKDALLVLDMMNEIVLADGAWGKMGYGYGSESERRGVVAKTATAIAKARDAGIPVIYVTVGYDESYGHWPASSPVFTEAGRAAGLLKIGSWGQRVHDDLAPREGELLITKRRVSPFYATDLEVALRTQGIERLLLCGVATDHVVMATARDGHDRDFEIKVFEDCCAAAAADRHAAAIVVLDGVAEITSSTSYWSASDDGP